MIIDAHVHLIPEVQGLVAEGPVRDLGYGKIAIGQRALQLVPPFNERTYYTAEMLIAQMDWARVDRAFVLQGTYYGPCNDYALESIARYPDRLAGAAWVDPWAPGARETFARIFGEEHGPASAFRAVKIEFSTNHGLWGLHPGAQIYAPGNEWLWRELERRGLALTLDLGKVGTQSYQTEGVRRIATEHPDLRIVVAHLAQPNRQVEADPQLWAQCLEQLDLGKLPNVWFDLAALPIFLPEEDFPFPSVARYLQLAVERIGPNKLLWGSDQPGLLVVVNYLQLVRLAQLHLAFLSPDEQALVLHKNAQAVYGI
jgi:predicted TIM-barrel fold metal-dependent hydrolase